MTSQTQGAFTPQVLDLDGDKAIDEICTRMREILSRDLSRRGFVIAMSGGIDSSVCAALAVRAVGKERSASRQQGTAGRR